MSQPVAAYPIRVEGRPDFGNPDFGKTFAKKHPKYVHGRLGMSSLLHKVAYVKLYWYAPGGGGEYLIRLSTPHRIIATTMCGYFFHLEDAGRAGVCELPKPDTVLCGKCQGEGVTFPKNRAGKVSKREAKVKLGCGSAGVSTKPPWKDVTDWMRA